jgi:hypothetical protein
MGYIYLIYDSYQEAFKIGVTKGDVKKRLKKLQTGNPMELRLIYKYKTEYPYRLETMLHNHYKNHQILNEWYGGIDEGDFIRKCEEFNDIIISLIDNPFFNKDLK